MGASDDADQFLLRAAEHVGGEGYKIEEMMALEYSSLSLVKFEVSLCS